MDNELYKRALFLVAKEQTISTTIFQRELKVSYADACELLDSMEQSKYVGEFNGSKPREVYIKLDEDGNVVFPEIEGPIEINTDFNPKATEMGKLIMEFANQLGEDHSYDFTDDAERFIVKKFTEK